MYIFYDTETSGLDKEFSQILQIALVFTDDDMNILSSKKVECRRSPWVVPSPGAMLITGFTPDQLKNNKLSHYEMMHEVDDWARAQYWPVIFSGFNNHGFDEEVLAHNLHQTLLDPGLTTAANAGNGQENTCCDVSVITRAVTMYMPGALTLETKNEFGYPSMSLMNVAQQNGVTLSSEDAHDAMNDIKATVGLAKVLKKLAPTIWDHMMTLSTPAGVDDFVRDHKIFTTGYLGYGKTRGAVVTAVTERAEDPAVVMFDLSYDPAPYLDMTVEQLKDVILTQNKRVKGPQPPKPFRMESKLRQPVLMPMQMSDAVIPAKFDEKQADARADAVRNHPSFAQNLARAAELAYAEEHPKPAYPQAEQQMGAIDPAVRSRLDKWMKDFNAAPDWPAAAAMLDGFYTEFEQDMKADPSLRRFVQFAGRIVFENAPGTLPPEKQQAMKQYIASHVLSSNPAAPQMTIAKAREELAKIEQERAEGKSKWQHVTDTQLRSLKLYYTAIEKEYAPYLNPGADQTPANDDSAPQVSNRANDRFRPGGGA